MLFVLRGLVANAPIFTGHEVRLLDEFLPKFI